MKQCINILFSLKQLVFIVALLGVVLQSSVQTVSLFLDIEIANLTTTENEEELEEEEFSKKELKDEQHEYAALDDYSSSFSLSSKVALSTPNDSILNFILEIQIPPPDEA